MSYQKDDMIQYRLDKAQTILLEEKSLADLEFWSGTMNRLYYSSFYAVIAILATGDIAARMHNGVRTEFFRLYIKTGILEKNTVAYIQTQWGRGRRITTETFRNLKKMIFFLLLLKLKTSLPESKN